MATAHCTSMRFTDQVEVTNERYLALWRRPVTETPNLMVPVRSGVGERDRATPGGPGDLV